MKKYLARRRLDRLEARLAHRPKSRYIKLYAVVGTQLTNAINVPLCLAPGHMHSVVVRDGNGRPIEIRAVTKASENQ